MRSEDREAIEAAAVSLNNAIYEEKSQLQSLRSAEERHLRAKEGVKKAREAFLKLMIVGRNVPMKAVRIPDVDATLVVQYHSKPTHDDGAPGGSDRMSVHYVTPERSEEV